MVPTGVQLGLGVRPAAVSMNPAFGSIRATTGDLDVAIEGKGYLEVTMPSGLSAYTRDGSLKLTGDGNVVTSDGYPFVPNITIPADARDVSINGSGEVFVYFSDEPEGQLLGQLTLVNFVNEKGLEAIGSNLYRESAASGQPQQGNAGEDGLGRFRQGYLEESSVDPVREITELIEAQRGYELNAKVISAADQMLGSASQIR